MPVFKHETTQQIHRHPLVAPEIGLPRERTLTKCLGKRHGELSLRDKANFETKSTRIAGVRLKSSNEYQAKVVGSFPMPISLFAALENSQMLVSSAVGKRERDLRRR